MSQHNQRKRIVAVCYGAAHVEMLWPLIPPLRATSEVVLIGINTAQNYLINRQTHFIGIPELVSLLGIEEEVRVWGEQAVSITTEPLSLSSSNSIAYLGLNLHDLALQFGRDKAIQMYLEQGRKCFYPIHFARALLNHYQPDLVLATSAPRLERAVVEAAGLHSIPSFVVVDQYPTHEMEWLRSPAFGCQLAVLNSKVKESIVQAGRPANDIVVTGNPAYDGLERVKNTPREQPVKIVFLSQSENNLSAVASGETPMVQTVLKELLEGAEQHDWAVIYRPHPNELVLDLFHPRLTINAPNSTSLIESLTGASVVVTATSTAGIQALLAGIPLVQLAFTPRIRRPPFEAFGSTYIAQQPNEICSSVLQALSTPFFGGTAIFNATSIILQRIHQIIHAPQEILS